MRLATPVSFLLLTAAVATQDPPAPPGGFPLIEDLDRLTTWSDGYRTRTDVRYPAAAPPATGWPAVLLLHGNGGSRKARCGNARSNSRARAM
jgi:hypothetical protein